MKRNASLGPFLLIVPLVIAASFAAGYYLVGNHSAAPPPPAPALPSPPTSEALPKPAPVKRRVVAAAGQYTAPGSPKISISEVHGEAPVKKPPVVADPEASETGVAPPPAPDLNPPPPDVNPSPAPSDGQTPGDNANPPGDAASPTDETTSGTAPAPPVAPAPTGPLFHVQTKAGFQNEKNAKNFAEALRRRGYTAMPLPFVDSSGLTAYRDQVGAYRNRATADAAAAELQRYGYPAEVSSR